MGKNRTQLRKVALQQSKAVDGAGPHLTAREAIFLGASSDASHERPFVNLKYYASNYQCFSEWPAVKLKSFSDFCRKLSQSKWNDIYKTGGVLGAKTGFGYTVHKDTGKLPINPDLANLSEDLTWFELRVDQEARVHGFRVKDAFCLVYLDHDHTIHSM